MAAQPPPGVLRARLPDPEVVAGNAAEVQLVDMFWSISIGFSSVNHLII